MWVQLSTSIAGGLTFATVMTLLITPVMLVLGEQYGVAITACLKRYWKSGTAFREDGLTAERPAGS